VTATGRRWRGAVELDVALVRRSDDDPPSVPALAYPALVGEPVAGDRVLLNLNAWALGLGSGGYALVVALPDRLPADDETQVGHVVKARYTPLQAVVLAADEEASPHRAAAVRASELGPGSELAGMPVVTADLHSALPAVLAGVQATRADARVAYVMTDGGALPAWFSRTLAALADRLVGVVTVGQAFGGDLEATNVYSGLIAARHVLGAEVTVVAQGPGNLGTGTAWGFSGTAVGEAVNAVVALGGWAVGSVRLSGADPRPRHRGVSHHCLTAYGRVALAPADLVVPEALDPDLDAEVTAALAALCPPHRVVRVDNAGLDAALRALPVTLSTMGRGLDTDHAYFLAAACAGRHAAHLLNPAAAAGASTSADARAHRP
jgi:Protein of unknown function (DUF3866)